MNYKTLLVSVMALTMIGSTNAQSRKASKEHVKIGIRAGVSSMTTFGIDDYVDESEEDCHEPFKDRALPGVRAGVSVTCPIANHWGVETGAYYQQYGGTNKIYSYGYLFDSSLDMYRDSWTVKTRLHGVNIPVMCHYGREFGMRGSMYWDAFAGPYARFTFSGEAKTTHRRYSIKTNDGVQTATYTKEETTTDALDVSEVYNLLNGMEIKASEVTINKVGAGILFGGGVTFFNHFYAGLSFDLGLSPVMKFYDGSRFWDDECHMKLSAISFNIGYTF